MKAVMTKMVLMVASVVVLGTSAQAASPLLKVRTAGGMPAPGGIAVREITLMTDGTATVFERRHPSMEDWNTGKGTTVTYNLLTVQHAPVLKELRKKAARIKGGDIVPADPDAPPCMDAPNTYYLVVKRGKDIEIASRRACQAYHLADQDERWKAEELKSYLEALERFSY